MGRVGRLSPVFWYLAITQETLTAGAIVQLQNLFFHFQREQFPFHGGLGLIGGGLILDSGEADPSFMYRCQDRYFVYTSLFGMRSLFLVMNQAHESLYKQNVQELRAALSTLQRHTGIKLFDILAEPLYLTYDANTNRVSVDHHFITQFRQSGLSQLAAIYANQISPSCAELIEQLSEQLSVHNIKHNFDSSAYRRAAALASRFHDKQAYFELIARSAATQTVGHTPTLLIDEQKLLTLDSWEKIYHLAIEHGVLDASSKPKLFIKSTLDSGGNTSAVLSPDDFQAQYSRLRQAIRQGVHLSDTPFDVALQALQGVIADSATLSQVPGVAARTNDWLSAWMQNRRSKSVRYLLQRCIAGSPQAPGALPSGVGFSLFIDQDKNVNLIAIAGQIYSDIERKHHLGSLLSTRLEQTALSVCKMSALKKLCQLFADEGYRGPISFDAVLNERHEYEFIYDCNPRLTAVMPSLAVKTALTRLGHTVESIINLDYRGRFLFPDLAAVLRRLKRDGLLFTASHPRGLLILPNIARKHGYDILLVNLEQDEALEAMRHSIFNDNFDIDKGRIDTLHL